MNEMIGDARIHWSRSAKVKKEATELVALQCLRLKPIQAPCIVSFHWFYSGREDFDNISGGGRKHVLDGLQQSGRLPNDNQKWVIGFGQEQFTKVPKGQDAVVVTIIEKGIHEKESKDSSPQEKDLL